MSWRQTGEFSSLFLGGSTNMLMGDGFWVPAPCICPCVFIVPPSLPCPIGTTAFISQGDIDGDGINDVGAFVSAAEVVRAIRIEPYRPDQIRIIAAPPSGIADLLRGSNGDTSAVFDVVDATVTLFYNTLTPPVDDFDISIYEARRPYGPGREELERHFRDVPWGTYLFTLPALGDPERPVPFAAEYLVAPDPYPGRGRIPSGWRLVNSNWVDDDMVLDPRLFFEFDWVGLDGSNVVATDRLLFSMRGHQYIETQKPGFTVQRRRSVVPPRSVVDATVTSVSCYRLPPFDETTYAITSIAGTFITVEDLNGDPVDLTEELNEGASYTLTVQTGGLVGRTQEITEWGEPDPFTLQTPDDLSDPADPDNMVDPPQLVPGDQFTLAQVRDAVSIVTVDRNLTEVLEADANYEVNVLSGDFRVDPNRGPLSLAALTQSAPANTANSPGVQYPITVIGPQDPAITTPNLTEFEFLTASDLSGGYVSGTITEIDGSTITTNRDLDNCLTRESYRLRITSGALQGQEQFPITLWANPTVNDLTLANPLPGLAEGDEFLLIPEDIIELSTVQTVAGFFIEGDRDLAQLTRGEDYTLEIKSGALAGQTKEVSDFGFPGDFWFETVQDLSGSLLPGDTYELRPVSTRVSRLRVGDEIDFSQRFPDWVQKNYDDGEIAAVDALTLFLVYNIFPSGDLSVAPGLYAIAREDQIVFPPFPIETPPGDRSEFFLSIPDSFYEFGPFLFQVGDSANSRLRFSRNRPVGGDVFDVVDRLLNWEIQFLDTYEGFALLGRVNQNDGFPFGVPRSGRLPEGDFDSDGATNLMEFALGTNVNDPNDRPEFRFARDGDLGSCSAMITKRPNVGKSVLYYFEYSGDLVNWTRITPSDPIFDIVQDNEDVLEVSNLNAIVAGAFPQPSCFLRVVVEVNPITTQTAQ